MSENVQTVERKVSTIKRVALMAIMGALAFVLMSFEFPLPFIAPPCFKDCFTSSFQRNGNRFCRRIGEFFNWSFFCFASYVHL